MHTRAHKSKACSVVIDWTETGLAVLVCTGLWDSGWFQMPTEIPLFISFEVYFSLQLGHCVYWVYFIVLNDIVVN